MAKAAITIDPSGTPALRKAVSKLGKMSRQRKVLRSGLQAATTPINKAAKQHAPTNTKTLKKSIGKVTRTYTKDGTVVVIIGPRAGHQYTDDAGFTHRPTLYAHLVEFGTKHSQARPFLRPAYDNNMDEAQRLFQEKAWQVMEKEASRVAAKGK